MISGIYIKCNVVAIKIHQSIFVAIIEHADSTFGKLTIQFYHEQNIVINSVNWSR